MNTQPGIYGRKLGCTQIFEADGSVTRVTVIEAGPVVVLGKRTPEKDGYVALVLGFEDRKEKHTSKPLAGYFKKTGSPAKRLVKELRCDAAFAATLQDLRACAHCLHHTHPRQHRLAVACKLGRLNPIFRTLLARGYEYLERALSLPIVVDARRYLE